MRGGAGRGCGADLEHCENAGRIYQVYAGLSYELADLRIMHTDKRGHKPKTDLSCGFYGSTELSINISIVYYVLLLQILFYLLINY